MKKIKVEEAIIVEGRDDTQAINNALDCMTIETHGFGITKNTWKLIDRAYKEKGIIVFTDPDFSGREIRKRITKAFPKAKQAYLPLKESIKNGDIGIENAKPEAIIKAIEKVHYAVKNSETDIDMSYIYSKGLISKENSSELREKVCDILGIGYCNGKTFLKRLKAFNISKNEVEEALRKIKNENI
ncbi:MAG TPA: ribonuclease M5 [Anaerovoracaceae bacterium]|nr:ribonuclease M5 [Anaerovoracaceae bacterium]